MITLSSSASSRLETELAELVDERAARASEFIETTGDAADLAEFAARDMLVEQLDERISAICGLLAENTVPVQRDAAAGHVAEGSVVSVRFGRSRATETFLVGHRFEATGGVDVITPSSPLGQVLIGAKAGDTISYGAPTGSVDVTLVDVRAA